jgi:CheY-like chemotaxis protein
VRRKRRSADTLDDEGPGPLGQLVVEALDRVATSDARDSVLYMALADGGLPAIPEDPSTFRRFALGPLRRAMFLTLGDEFADAVLSDLTPIIERAASTITSNPPAGKFDAHARSLVIATADVGRARRLIADAPEGARTRMVQDVFDLVTAVDAFRQTRLVVVLDSTLPSVSTAALSTLSRVLPTTASVLLLGEPNGSFSSDWKVLPHDASARQIVQAAFPDAPEPGAHGSEDPIRVLLIDRDATLRAGIAADLAADGMEVRSAPDAMMGVELVGSWNPSAVVVTSALSGVDPERFCGLVRRMMGTSAPSIIVLVANQTEMVSGADELLVRGVDEHRIAEVVRTFHSKAPS